MRIYGRTRDTLTGKKTWVEVVTDDQGHNDMVRLTHLIQVLKLNLEESPFWASWGIPAVPSVMTQVPPDYYVALTQRRFTPYFMSIVLTREPDAIDETRRPAPSYHIAVVTNQGATIEEDVPV